MYLLKFRPSGHSTHFTYISTFKDPVSTKLAKKKFVKNIRKLMSACNDIMVESDLCEMMISGYTGDSDRTERRRITRFLKNLSGIKMIRGCRDTSDYTQITVTLPAKTTPQVALMVLPKEQAQVLRDLMQIFKFKINHTKAITTIVFVENLHDDPRRFMDISLFSRYCTLHNIETHKKIAVDLRWKNWKISTMPPQKQSTLKLRTILFTKNG